jgi:hypothetical protein
MALRRDDAPSLFLLHQWHYWRFGHPEGPGLFFLALWP